MTHLFLINPAAGKQNRTEILSGQIRELCEKKGLDYRITISHAPGDCRRITREAAESGEEYRIYACGGDGTLNEVAAGAAGFPNVSITNYAGGSGNDFVKMFGSPASFQDLEALLDSEEILLDLIRCNGDFSLNITSVGLDARIGTEMSAYKRLPFVSGSLAYILSTVVNLLKGISEHYVVEIEGETIDAKQTMICVCNGQFYGGSFHPVPDSDPTDGLLDVLLVRDVSLLKAATIVGQYKAGKYADYPQYIRHFRTTQLRIHCDRETPINLDGELRTAKTVDISLATEKLRFFYPKALSRSKTFV